MTSLSHTPVVRLATLQDVHGLVNLMEQFHAESGYVLDRAQAEAAFRTLIAQPALGCVLLAYRDAQPIGHAVLTVGFAMDCGGLCGCIDDLFVAPAFRRCGGGDALIAAVVAMARQMGCRAMHVEVGASNVAACALYAKYGLRRADDDRITLRDLGGLSNTRE